MTIVSGFVALLKQLQAQPACGWIPDPHDERDEAHSFSTTPAYSNYSSSVGVIDNSRFFKPVSFQSRMPACTANGGADLLEALDVKAKYDAAISQGMKETDALRIAQDAVPDYSRMFLWWNGRNEMDPPQHKNPESGCYNRLIMDVASRFGVCTESVWPYDEQKLPPNWEPRSIVRPSLSAYRNARGHMTTSYHPILANGDERLSQTVKALQAVPGVLIGTALGPDFANANGNVVMRPSKITGRHALVIVGYDPVKRAFLVRNSWGLMFGINGYFWMHESYVAWSGSNSFWVCTKGVLS